MCAAMKSRIDLERLATLYRDGRPLREIADIFGVSTGSISDRLYRMRKEGFDLPHRQPRRTKPRRTVELHNLVKALRAEGMDDAADFLETKYGDEQ